MVVVKVVYCLNLASFQLILICLDSRREVGSAV